MKLVTATDWGQAERLGNHKLQVYLIRIWYGYCTRDSLLKFHRPGLDCCLDLERNID